MDTFTNVERTEYFLANVERTEYFQGKRTNSPESSIVSYNRKIRIT